MQQDGKQKEPKDAPAGLALEAVMSDQGAKRAGGPRVLAAALRLAAEIARACRSHGTLPIGNGQREIGTQMGAGLLMSPVGEAARLLGKAKPPPTLSAPLLEFDAEMKQLRQAAELAKAPLSMYKLPPVPIKTYNPRFDEAFVPSRDMDPDRERAERSRLKRQHKAELKGAVRELRKDNAFIEHHRALKLREQRAARDERGKAIETFFAQQQFEAKLGAGKRKGKGGKRK